MVHVVNRKAWGRYDLDVEAFGRLVLRSEFMKADMLARAERVKETFQATAPVGSPAEGDDHPGRYRDSAHVESGTMRVPGGSGERAYGRVVVEDEAAMSIEFGHTASNGRQVEGSHTLTRALDAAG